MLWPFVPNDLSQVTHLDLLSANRASVKVIILVGMVIVVRLAGNWRTKGG